MIDKSKILVGYRKYSTLRLYLPADDKDFLSDLYARLAVNRTVTTREAGKLRRYVEQEPCYSLTKDPRGMPYIVVGYGFLNSIRKLADKYGYIVEVVRAMPMGKDFVSRFVPNLKVLDEYTWRDNQRSILEDILTTTHGQYVAATGAGKSYLILACCRLFPRARILITTYSKTVLRGLHKELVREGIDAGISASGVPYREGRVMLCTVGTLAKMADRVFDFTFLDEKHECATLSRIHTLQRVNTVRAYALSANHNDRRDQADRWLEAVFGDCRVSANHTDAVKDGDIVPVEVRWLAIPNAKQTTLAGSHPQFERVCYWRNQERNELAAKYAKKLSDQGQQVLLYVKTVEHAYQLWRLLKCPVVHSPVTPKDWKARKEREALPDNIGHIPDKVYMDKIKSEFESGELKLVIANQVWQRGVNFVHLRHLFRLDASTTQIDATQVTGRVTRKAENKDVGVIWDFLDRFNGSTTRRAARRRAAYAKIGYQQHEFKE